MRASQRLREIPCPDNREARLACRYYPECHPSKHHIFSKELGRTAIQLAAETGRADLQQYSEIVRAFISDSRNHVRTCRQIHDTLDELPPYALPDEEYMKGFLDEQP